MIRRVLVIEDQQTDNRRAIRRLAEEGYDVVLALGPEAAKVQLAENPDIDLIILDSIMESGRYAEEDTRQGTLTGFVLYKRELERTGIPVVLWTVLGDAFEPRRGSNEDDSWGRSVILKTRKRMEQDELVNIVKRCEDILRHRRS